MTDPLVDPLEVQIAGALTLAAVPWGEVIGDDTDVWLTDRMRAAIESITTRLEYGDPSTLAALRAVLGPREPAWYGTPLGRLVAPHWLGESVPTGFAAKMLGVTVGRVHQLLGEGKLARWHEGGTVTGVSVRSILDRMKWLDDQK